MQTATVHALPACDLNRIFEVRRAAELSGARYIPRKPHLVKAKPTPIDPNDGGRAA